MLSRKVAVCALALVLASCSTTDLLKGAAKAVTGGTDHGIQADAQIGDRENKVDLGNKDSHSVSNIRAQTVTVTEKQSKGGTVEGKVDKVVINNNDPKTIIWLVVVGLLGWLLPTPSALWSKFKSVTKNWKLPSVTLWGKASVAPEPTNEPTQVGLSETRNATST